MWSAKAGSATSRVICNWDQIVWPSTYCRVRRLQTRIAKATRDQNWRRVKSLQRFLVNSFSAKALAVKRVSENDGKRTPGVDGEVWSTPGAKWQAIQRLSSRGLRPQPLRRVYIPKRGGNTKMRPLGIPTMVNRAEQALHLQGLEPVAETRADPHSYGFRRSRGTRDAIGQVFHLLARKVSAPWILEGDILPRIASHNFVTGCVINTVTRAWSFPRSDLHFTSPTRGRLPARSAGRSSGFDRGDRTGARDCSAPLALTSCVCPLISQINR